MRRLAATALALLAGQALAHGGGLDKYGCHTNRKTGDYHCHRAPATTAAPQRVAPQQGEAPPATEPAGSKCYVGPRGGTYTITPSGRKNYSGC